MSLYQLQKFLYELNREPALQEQHRADLPRLLDRYELTAEERRAIEAGFQIHVPKPVEPEALLAVISRISGWMPR